MNNPEETIRHPSQPLFSPPDLRAEKQILRANILRRLKSLSPAQCSTDSAAACSRLRQQDVWNNAGSILFYAPMAGELDITPLADQASLEGKLIALPKYSPASRDYAAVPLSCPWHDLPKGKFGIPEPPNNSQTKPLNQLDLILVPGLAFTPSGWRIGRGLGFYDRLLVNVRGIKCGVAFDAQLADQIPVEPHDIRMDCLLTPSRWFAAGRNPTET